MPHVREGLRSLYGVSARAALPTFSSFEALTSGSTGVPKRAKGGSSGGDLGNQRTNPVPVGRVFGY